MIMIMSDNVLLHMSCQIISECYGNLFINFLRLYVRFGSPICLLLLWLCQVHLGKISSEEKTRWKSFFKESLLRKKNTFTQNAGNPTIFSKNWLQNPTVLIPIDKRINSYVCRRLLDSLYRYCSLCCQDYTQKNKSEPLC